MSITAYEVPPESNSVLGNEKSLMKETSYYIVIDVSQITAA
jgi:hypothetical protein